MYLLRESTESDGLRGGSSSCKMMHPGQLAHLPLHSRLHRNVLPGSTQEDTSKAASVVTDSGRGQKGRHAPPKRPEGDSKATAAFSWLISSPLNFDGLSQGWVIKHAALKRSITWHF